MEDFELRVVVLPNEPSKSYLKLAHKEQVVLSNEICLERPNAHAELLSSFSYIELADVLTNGLEFQQNRKVEE